MSVATATGLPRSTPRWSERLATYQELSKSGIVTLVLISVLGGYLAGQPFEQSFDLGRMLLTLLGILFLASGSSALNQLQEHRLDAAMPRTAKRPIPSGRLTTTHAAVFVAVMLALGLGILTQINASVALLGLAAVILYNGFYTLWWKKHWAHAAVPGALPGALPILMGYAAADGRAFTPGGVYLFAILFFWQMPHFWVLALRFREDYAKGGFPTLPVAHGEGVTIRQIAVWCLAYVGVALIAPLFLHVGTFYLAATVLMSLKILWELRAFARDPGSKKWLHFFLWVNLSLIVYIGAAVADLWSIYLIRP